MKHNQRTNMSTRDQVSDVELASVVPPKRWRRFGLRGPAIVLRWLTRNAKRIAVLIAGLAVLLAGAAMLVLPGPGIIVVILGLAILATEFAWAEQALDRTSASAATAISRATRTRNGRATLLLSGLILVAAGTTCIFVTGRTIVGVSVVLGGVIGLISLAPGVQRRVASPTGSKAKPADKGPTEDSHPSVESSDAPRTSPQSWIP